MKNCFLSPFYQPASKMRVLRFAIREEGYFSILQGLEIGWRGLRAVATRTKIMKKESQIIKKGFAQKFKTAPRPF